MYIESARSVSLHAACFALLSAFLKCPHVLPLFQFGNMNLHVGNIVQLFEIISVICSSDAALIIPSLCE